jgi:hypothetical protein
MEPGVLQASAKGFCFDVQAAKLNRQNFSARAKILFSRTFFAETAIQKPLFRTLGRASKSR